jgi:O-acetyl-ADP-ribose deacetylase (regulator of RNase III)
MSEYLASTPTWVVVISLIILITFAALLAAMVQAFVGRRAYKVIELPDMTIELWVSERRFPRAADAVVVPVATDLKMVAGVAKVVRDATANRLQIEADAAAPLAPGDAFAGSGGKYRFGSGILAVVMDAQKRTTPEWITGAISKAIDLAQSRAAHSILIPDMTEDLLRQPPTITEEERRRTCGPVARALVDGIAASRGKVHTVCLWVWSKGTEDILAEELERLKEGTALHAA